MPKRQVPVVRFSVIVLALGVATYFLMYPKERLAPVVAIKAKAAQEKASSLVEAGTVERLSLRQGSPPAEAVEGFIARARSAGADLDDEILRSAFETLYGFSGALGEAEPSGYAGWAQQRGHVMRSTYPVDGGRDGRVLRGVYEELTGEPASPDLTPEELFQRFYSMRASSPDLRPVAMLLGDRILGIDFHTFTDPADTFDYIPFDFADSGPGQSFWIGSSAHPGVRLWDPPRSLDEIIESDGAAPAMRVRFVLELAGGKFMIFIAEMIFDPSLRQWHVHRLSQRNSMTVMPDWFPMPVF
jgi:hypothetical protein